MRTSTPLVAWMVAQGCSDAPVPTPVKDPAGQQLTGPVVVDAHQVPVAWTSSRGETFATARIVGDVTGDGLVDGVVHVLHSGDTLFDAYLVPGPLRRGHTLPDAAIATVTDVLWVSYAGDVDGDTNLDLLADIGSFSLQVLPGPLAGALPAATTGFPAPAGAGPVTLDADEVTDWVALHVDPTTASLVYDLDTGPIDTDAFTPERSVRVGCEGYGADDLQPDALLGLPDVTGDGVRELWLGISTDSPSDGCNALFSMPDLGQTADPAHDPAAMVNVPPLVAVPDQTGDGLDDVLLTRSRALAPAPVAFADGALTTTSFPFDPALSRVWSAGVDLTGDGVTDFLGYAEGYDAAGDPLAPFLSAALVVIAGGEAGIAARSFDTVYDIFDGPSTGPAVLSDVFVEDGVASVLVTYGDAVSVLDLGPVN